MYAYAYAYVYMYMHDYNVCMCRYNICLSVDYICNYIYMPICMPIYIYTIHTYICTFSISISYIMYISQEEYIHTYFICIIT